MRVLMLGWEYPPQISGGLGTACEGLTTALARHGVEVIFVVPHLFGSERAPHMTLVNAKGQTIDDYKRGKNRGRRVVERRKPAREPIDPNQLITKKQIPSYLQPYFTPEQFKQYMESLAEQRRREEEEERPKIDQDQARQKIKEIVGYSPESTEDDEHHNSRFQAYGTDLFSEVGKFAAKVTKSLAGEDFDLIHCHDWMTYPAGVAVAQASGKPLIVHVHSLEYDRSGVSVNPQIHHIEKFGVTAAKRIVAVSYYTRRIVAEQHGIPLEKIGVVHNGIYSSDEVLRYRSRKKWPGKVVLFLGRITYQKGPDYFVEAALKVIPHVPDVLFVMAGSGDMLQRIIGRVNQMGIGSHFQFPGFLKGQEVEEMFSLADLYVMPSVSEPFGITALEALKFDTPVIISKQSGVAEVLAHALKVDFWDVDRMADLMINALRHDELRADMVSMAREELKKLHWDAAALKVREIYSSLMGIRQLST